MLYLPKTPSALLLQDVRASSIGASAGVISPVQSPPPSPRPHRLEAGGREAGRCVDVRVEAQTFSAPTTWPTRFSSFSKRKGEAMLRWSGQLDTKHGEKGRSRWSRVGHPGMMA